MDIKSADYFIHELPPVLETQHASSSLDVAVGTAVNKNFTHVFVKHRPAVSIPFPVSSCREHVLPSSGMWSPEPVPFSDWAAPVIPSIKQGG